MWNVIWLKDSFMFGMCFFNSSDLFMVVGFVFVLLNAVVFWFCHSMDGLAIRYARDGIKLIYRFLLFYFILWHWIYGCIVILIVPFVNSILTCSNLTSQRMQIHRINFGFLNSQVNIFKCLPLFYGAYFKTACIIFSVDEPEDWNRRSDIKKVAKRKCH